MSYAKNMKHHIPTKSYYNELSFNYLDFKSYIHVHLSWIDIDNIYCLCPKEV